jgi:4-amino-4-deoxy-L-arabinose transferase-like glycosyltransferase
VALCLIVLLGSALRLYRLDTQSVWFDESFSVAHSVKPVPEVLQILLRDGYHPPLHSLILHGWFGIAGFGAMEARLVSVIVGTLSIPLLFVIARHFTDSITSLCAALLLATSQIAIYFSQEARPYALAQFLSLLAVCSFLRMLRRPSFGRTAVLAVVSLALLATHYYGIATLAALGLYWQLFRRDYSPVVFRRLVIVAGFVLLAYSPWLLALRGYAEFWQEPVFGTQFASQGPGPLSLVMALNRFNNGKFESIEAESSVVGVVLGLVIFTLPTIAGTFWLARGERGDHPAVETLAFDPKVRNSASDLRRLGVQGLVLGCLLVALPVGLAILAGALGAVFNYRHYSFAVPGYYLAVTIGWQACFRRPVVRAVWVASALGLSAWALRANYFAHTKPDYRAALAPMAAGYQQGDCAVGLPRIWNGSMHLAWDVYYRDRGSPTLVPFDSLRRSPPDCERLWIIWDQTWWMNRSEADRRRSMETIAALSLNFDVVKHYQHPDLDLRLLRRKASR